MVLLILLAEWLVFFFSGVTFSSLSGNSFYDIKADVFYWLPFLSGIPQIVMADHWAGIILDVFIFICLLYQIRFPFKTGAARILFPLLFLFYITLTAYLTHRNYPTGIFIVIIPFMFAGAMNRKMAFEAIRYFLLWFYFSAGFLKISVGSISEPGHLSHFLTHQFAPYYIENNTGWRTSLNQFLIQHNSFAYSLFLGSVIIELAALVGFFTHRFDRWLMVLFLLFHVCNWILMDIAFIGQAAFLSILMFSYYAKSTKTG